MGLEFSTYGPPGKCREESLPTGKSRGTIIHMTSTHPTATWLTVPDLVDLLDLSVSRVRTLIEDKHLLAVRREGIVVVPEDFIRDGKALPELRGTLILLMDAGFSDDGAMNWMLEDDDSLDARPIDALRAGRKAEVRRVAQALA